MAGKTAQVAGDAGADAVAPAPGEAVQAGADAPDADRGAGADGAPDAGDPAGRPAAEPPPPPDAPEAADPPDPVREPVAPAVAPAPAVPAPAPAPRSNPLLPVLGGMVAAVFGFVLAQVVPQGWPLDATARQIAAFEARLADQDRRLATLVAPDPALADRLAALESQVAALPAGGAGIDPAVLDGLRAEIEALKQAPAAPVADLGPVQADLAALKQDLEGLRADVAAVPRESVVAQELEAMKAAADAERAAAEARAAALQAEAESLRAQAEATARTAVARGAVLRVQAALEAGGPLDAALADLGAAGVAVPEALSAHAEGVPTLAELQAGFGDAARAALAATAKPDPEAGLADRVTGFLKAQTGLRSTAPRDGDSPDAVLSRAEAALRAGDLPAALAELDSLPPDAAPALADWRALADTRAAAAAALAALAADLDAK